MFKLLFIKGSIITVQYDRFNKNTQQKLCKNKNHCAEEKVVRYRSSNLLRLELDENVI